MRSVCTAEWCARVWSHLDLLLQDNCAIVVLEHLHFVLKPLRLTSELCCLQIPRLFVVMVLLLPFGPCTRRLVREHMVELVKLGLQRLVFLHATGSQLTRRSTFE